MSGDRPTSFSGVVLTGGGSTRLGQDKALLAVDGRALAATVASALRGAGATEVVAVGGDRMGLDALGVFDRVVDDEHPGAGPLGGLVTALTTCAAPVAVVLACDTPEITSDTPRALVDAIGARDVAVGIVEGREQPLTAAWRRAAVLPIAESLFRAGERAPRTLLRVLRCAPVELPTGAVRDVDRREDLARYAPVADRITDGADGRRIVGLQDDRSAP